MTLNIGSDLLINKVQLDSADTKIGIKDVVKEVLELKEKWKYLNFRVKFSVFWKNLLEIWYTITVAGDPLF